VVTVLQRKLTAVGTGLCSLLLALALIAVAGASTAVAQAPQPHWRILTRTAPKYLHPGEEGWIVATVINLGDAPVTGTESNPIKITDNLPAEIAQVGKIEPLQKMVGRARPGDNYINGRPVLHCESLPILSCPYVGTVPPGIAIEIHIPVKAELDKEPAGSESVALGHNEVTVTGGVYEAGTQTVPARSESATSSIIASHAEPPFGVETYELTPEDENGEPDLEAGSHPFQLTTSIALNQTFTPETKGGLGKVEDLPGVPELLRNLNTTLPAGLVGNTNSTLIPQCSDVDFSTIAAGNYDYCPPETAVGVAVVTFRIPGQTLKEATESIPVFNLVPAEGEPARFGFEFDSVPVVLDTSVLTGKGYAVEVQSKNTSAIAEVLSTVVTVWGVPDAASHDNERGWACLGGGYRYIPNEESTERQGPPCEPLAVANPKPYLTLPTTCEKELLTFVRAQSWEPGEELLPPLAASDKETLEGCGALDFEPSMSLKPDEQAASTPSGLNVKVTVPQTGTLTAGGLAEADIKDTTVQLPEGLEANAGAANGLEVCGVEAAGFTGKLSTEHPTKEEFSALEGETGSVLQQELATQGFTSGPATCPESAKIGTVKIHSPLLEDPIEGAVYLAEQDTNPFASPLVLYLIAEDKKSGVRVKLAGEVGISPSGQLTSTFADSPPLPFEELELNFFDGPRASQSTPSHCGIHKSEAELVSFSGQTVTDRPSFTTTPNPDGVPCPESGPLPFSPSFEAGSSDKQAGAFTPFTLTIRRPDGDAALKTIAMQLPPGLAAVLASVPLCQEPQAAEGKCGEESMIGESTTSSGLGGSPVTLPGKVYLTGPYDGAPFGLSSVTKVVAGSFYRGAVFVEGAFHVGTVVVRSGITVNETTAAATIDTAATRFISETGEVEEFAGLPEFIKGVPAQIKQLNVTVNRPGFEFNPTNCSAMATTGTLTAGEGAPSEPVSAPFEVTNCPSLPFTPKLTASVVGQGSKTNGTTFAVTVESPGLGQANIHKVDLTIPSVLPSRLTTIQKACVAAVFEVNPASCDEGSVIGEGIVHTPVFKNPLRGPAYLVSRGAEFPDVEFVLQGEGVKILLDGKTYIHAGITYSKFESAPDAPFTKFETIFPAGPHSALTPSVPETENFNLCRQSISLPTEITGQNGAFISQTTPVTITGCSGVLPSKVVKPTRAQLLAKALKACKKDKKKGKRVACERAARKKYGSKAKKASRKGAKKSSKK
jgi:hypothetical protein